MELGNPVTMCEYPILDHGGVQLGRIINKRDHSSPRQETWEVKIGEKTEILIGRHTITECINVFKRIYYGNSASQKITCH